MLEDLWYKTKKFASWLLVSKKGNRIERYGIPALIISILFLGPRISDVFFSSGSLLILSLLIITFSAWRNGYRPGLFSTFYATGLTLMLFERVYPIANHSAHFFSILFFLVEGILISILSAARRDAENQKDEFIALLSHELKNPLTVVQSYAGLLKKQAKQENDVKQYAYSSKVEAHTHKITDLINDLLDVTKITAGKLVFSDEHVHLQSLLNEVIEDQRLIIKTHKITLKGKSNKILWGDKYRLGQVITNLLTNAIKYSPTKDKIDVRIKDTKQGTVISIKDYGMGVDTNDVNKIFDRFYRGGAEKSNIHGLGMGLYISSQIIKRHKGKIWLKSRTKKGSTFFVELPTLSARKIRV